MKRKFILDLALLILTMGMGIIASQLSLPPIIIRYAWQEFIFGILVICIVMFLQSDVFPGGWEWLKQHFQTLFFVSCSICLLGAITTTAIYWFFHPFPPAANSTSDLAQYYCSALEKQDYHTLHYYMDAPFPNGPTVVNHQEVSDENTFVRLARSADKTGKVTGCHYVSEKPINGPGDGCGYGQYGGGCTEEYKIRLSVARGGSSYNVSMHVTMYTGTSGSAGWIDEIDRL